MDNIVEKLDNINRAFERHNEIMQKMLDVMPKPENRFVRVLEIVVLITTVLGILNAVDIVRQWITGGNDDFSICGFYSYCYTFFYGVSYDTVYQETS